MPSKNLKSYFKRAEREKWAIGQFNFSNLETLRAVIQAAQRLKSPFIVGTSERESKFIGISQAVALARVFEKETGISVVLNLDHGQSLDYIKKAVEAGYQAVHFDGSELSLEENIAATKKVVQLARKRKILVEGEVGAIGGELTEAEKAKRFVEETQVDSLAVNIGTWHGQGKKTGINFQRLKEIKEAVKNVPLVLHGGSGVPDTHIRKAIKMGIVKININTELRNVFTESLKKAFKEKPEETTPYKYFPQVVGALQKIVEEKIKLFGSVNKI